MFMDEEYRAQLEEQLRVERRLLHHDKMNQARMGINCDSSVLMRIEDREQVIAGLEAQLGIERPAPRVSRQEYRESPRPRYQPAPDLAQQHDADVRHQVKMLGIFRANLAHYQQQARAYGGIDYAPTITQHGIREAMEGITRAKRILRGYGIQVDDLRGDE